MNLEQANRLALKSIKEAAFRDAIVRHAQLRGWLVFFVPDKFHAEAARGGYLHRTKMGDKGFPDLTLVGPRSIVYAELKTESGRLSPEQGVWRDRIIAAGGEWYLWRPRDIDAAIARLEKG